MGQDHHTATDRGGTALVPQRRNAHRRQLTVVLALSAMTMLAELVVAVISGSVALLADAAHLFADVVAIGAALAAIVIASGMTTKRSSYGLYRVEIVVAALNALLLLGVCGFVVWTAIGRLRHPTEVQSGWMIAAALVGLVVNAVAMRVLHGSHADSINMRGAYLEVASDLLGSLSVVVAGVVIAAGGSTRSDPIASLVVSALIIPRTVLLLRDAAAVLLESAPRHVDVGHVRDHILHTSGVVDVHDLHLWTITSGMPVMSAHVVVDDLTMASGGSGQVLDRLQHCLGEHFDVLHSTFQIESQAHASHEGLTHP